MQTPMKVNFNDEQRNWGLWGQLVELWVRELQPRPETAAALVEQMTDHGIKGASVDGPPDLKVAFYPSDPDDSLGFMLPTRSMLKQARNTVSAGEFYPLPVFYDTAYTGSRKAFSVDEDMLFIACRVGEYVINPGL
ncbi:hypothetical protein [Rhodopila sp.]|uniref:hypothetical protein n=1 Tax=Rhodopila sp. TaxID=2480087 RepID=UPI003D0D8835